MAAAEQQRPLARGRTAAAEPQRPLAAARCAGLTWRRRPALPLGALHHVLGHALSAALLPLLLHQLLQLRLAGVDAALVGGAAGRRLLHGRRWSRSRLPDLVTGAVGGLRESRKHLL